MFPAGVHTYLFHLLSKAVVSLHSVSGALGRKRRLLGQHTKLAFQGLINNRIAYKLQSYSHLHHNDIIKLCQRAGILTAPFSHPLRDAHRRCTSCHTTARPRGDLKVSLFKLLENLMIKSNWISCGSMKYPDLWFFIW